MIDVPQISPRDTEKGAEKLINGWLKKYFTGVTHKAPLGDAIFPLVDILFNQASVPLPTVGRAQIHVVFTMFKPQETWFSKGTLEEWQTLLWEPASGVLYAAKGDSFGGFIQEGVHGGLVRRIRGNDIRWVLDGDNNFVEMIFVDGAWITERNFGVGPTEIQWIRRNGNYVEQTGQVVDGSAVWTDVRTVVPGNALWDGSLKLVSADPTLLTIYVRAANGNAAGQATDFLCRDVADNLKELLQRQSRSELAQKGLRGIHLLSGPVPIASTGYQTRQLNVKARMRYMIPRVP